LPKISLSGADKPDIVTDHRGRADRKRFRIGNVQFLELDPALPNLPQEILEDLDRELLTGAAAIAEAEGGESCMVADGQSLAVDNAIGRCRSHCYGSMRCGHPLRRRMFAQTDTGRTPSDRISHRQSDGSSARRCSDPD
jgi:hypothetical protein